MGESRCVYTSFEARDLYRADIPRQNSFLHVAGKSGNKGTNAVLRAWQQIPNGLPPLTVVASNPEFKALWEKNHSNIEFFQKVDESHLIQLMNSHRYHVAPSPYEGFGHSIHEALGCSALVVTTSAPPMSQIHGVAALVPVTTPVKQRLAMMYHVTPQDVNSTCRALVEESSDSKAMRSANARQQFLGNRNFFRKRIHATSGERMTNVLWFLGHPLCYDQTLINELFSGPEFQHSVFQRKTDLAITPDMGAIVVIPGRQCVEPPENDVPMLRAMLQRMKWAVVLITGDEESRFPFQELMLPNTRVWVMSPVQGKHDILGKRHLINGSQPHLHNSLKKLGNCAKDLQWYFAGQITHPRREQCAKVLRPLAGGKLIETKGFLQGVPPAEYYADMLRAKVVPCPSGPVELSTARIFEAIECGCVPVVDAVTPYPEYKNAAKPGYWQWFFDGEVPFPVIYDWAHFPKVLAEVLDDFNGWQGSVYKWWQDYKTGFRNRVMADVQALREGQCPTSQS